LQGDLPLDAGQTCWKSAPQLPELPLEVEPELEEPEDETQ